MAIFTNEQKANLVVALKKFNLSLARKEMADKEVASALSTLHTCAQITTKDPRAAVQEVHGILGAFYLEEVEKGNVS